MVLKEIAYGLAGNFIFSLMLFGYKRYYHEKYDKILEKLEEIEYNQDYHHSEILRKIYIHNREQEKYTKHFISED